MNFLAQFAGFTTRAFTPNASNAFDSHSHPSARLNAPLTHGVEPVTDYSAHANQLAFMAYPDNSHDNAMGQHSAEGASAALFDASAGLRDMATIGFDGNDSTLELLMNDSTEDFVFKHDVSRVRTRSACE